MPRPHARPIHPFAMLIDPAAVLARVEHSERLQGLARHVCRPLDTLRPGIVAEDEPQEEGEEPPRWASRRPADAAAEEAPDSLRLRS
ncbi:hypothetical protein JI742_08280 [Piscinibacter sp. Jin2]|uniref:Uncharacterized protein n=1 Tax=Aquariibacter lacus TaxID=2801332 RepID=A0A9X0XHV2_9BURK|nr:hypothetical protein [Piscinibacter lacus]MBL0719885.1 hypothetical protein [Piscinibacter lacus]